MGASAKPQPKVAKMTPNAAEQDILAYIDRQNRPLCVGNIVDALASKGLGPAQAKKSVQALCDKELVDHKIYNKSVYVLSKQDQYPSASPEELKEIDGRIARKKLELDGLNSSKNKLKAVCAQQEAQPTEEQLDADLAQLRDVIARDEGRMQELAGTKPVSKEDLAALKKKVQLRCKEWKARKRAVNELLSHVMETGTRGHAAT
jgi:chromosome segregation ATPase